MPELWRRVGPNSLVPARLQNLQNIVESAESIRYRGERDGAHLANGPDVSERHTQVHPEQKILPSTFSSREMMRSTPPISRPLLSICSWSTTRPLAHKVQMTGGPASHGGR